MVEERVIIGRPKNCPPANLISIAPVCVPSPRILTNLLTIVTARKGIFVYRVFGEHVEFSQRWLCLEEVQDDSDVFLLCRRELNAGSGVDLGIYDLVEVGIGDGHSVVVEGKSQVPDVCFDDDKRGHDRCYIMGRQSSATRISVKSCGICCLYEYGTCIDHYWIRNRSSRQRSC